MGILSVGIHVPVQLDVDENSADGTVVGVVTTPPIENLAAINAILNNANTGDVPTLFYNADTGKFYRFLPSPEEFADAQVNAGNELLNGVSGGLVTIDSAAENQYVADLIALQGITDVHLGASDSAVEGEWRWLDDGDQFSDGDGASVDGSFVAWNTGCLLYTSPSPRDLSTSRMPSSA